MPNSFSLLKNHPNPLNPNINITYIIPTRTGNDIVNLTIYDLLGREIITPVNKYQNPGKYVVNFDGSKLSSGIYYYQLKAGEFISTKKMILLK